MTETVVHVTTLEQWKSVLDVWFKQGHKRFASIQSYAEKTFEKYGSLQLGRVDDETKNIQSSWHNRKRITKWQHIM